ncbi:hypothetical protein I6F14_22885 [Bradyrhizobium sp. IC3069]|uniref:TonB C-terminal domain-containing protein n=1 Tax=Bradyrhizobium yuanmingense TaxID=108015 RepID=A0A0R3CCJ6_9BRAD|nr:MULTISPECIES: hypothetical protein [Bradyrhizobium]MCA1384589.1 hypothetical protein [Bradyrhizobium sp. BRP05]KRP92705.1 hypothetical protein AOQ72_31780 [Bradyrhizobium yuanmingense]MCA1361918.1 hypothetical protein [Bradyrhizobium sp. IC4059]MCA1388444.1 hypothetical protein [Bradyrhizobium sp. IC3123]MCA1421319.1 hypothetical protein [Bradyrhizobium sp. BRP23]
MARRGGRLLLVAAVLLLATSRAAVEAAQVDTIQDIFRHLRTCWRPPSPARARPLDITVLVSFNRAGNILGHPRITYESAEASDNDRLQYRIAVMEALQRCTPVPFTDAMAGAAAGRPFAIQFRSRKTSPDKTSPPTQERRA